MPRTKTKGKVKKYEDFKWKSSETSTFPTLYEDLKKPHALFNEFVKNEKGVYRFIGCPVEDVFKLKSKKGLIFLVHRTDLNDGKKLKWTVSEFTTGRSIIPSHCQPLTPNEAKTVAKNILKQVPCDEFKKLIAFHIRQNYHLLTQQFDNYEEFKLKTKVSIKQERKPMDGELFTSEEVESAKNKVNKKSSKRKPARGKHFEKSQGFGF